MLSSVLALALASTTLAAQTATVVVGGPSAALTFEPAAVTGLAEGDKVVFEFQQLNHSIVQTSFDSPCVAQDGDFFHSGFVRTNNIGNQTATTFEITIKNASAPIWYYCGQGAHCRSGMVGSINANAESPRNLEAFRQAASSVAVESITIPNPPDVRGGKLVQGDKTDILVPGNKGKKDGDADADVTTVLIQTQINIITVADGTTSTLGTTDLTYPASLVPEPTEQVTWLSADVQDGTTEYSTAWDTPTAGAALATPSLVRATDGGDDDNDDNDNENNDDDDSAAASIQAPFIAVVVAAAWGVVAML